MLRHELFKLTSLRWLRLATVGVLAATALMALVVAQALADPAAPLTDDVGLAHLVLRTSTPAHVCAALVGVACVRGDLRDGVLRLTLIAHPRRGQVLRAKFAAAASVSGVISATGAVTGLVVTSLATETAPPSVWAFGVAAHVAQSLLWVAAGVTAGTLVSHHTAAALAVLAVPLVVEPAMANVMSPPHADRLPFRSAMSLYAMMDSPASVAQSLVGATPMVMAMSLALALAARRFRALDI